MEGWSMAIPNYRDILLLHFNKMNGKKIAQTLKCSRNTVTITIRRAEEQKLPLPVADSISDEALRGMLFPGRVYKTKFNISCDNISSSLAADKNLTLKILWEEDCEAKRASKHSVLTYSQFCRHYQSFTKSHPAVSGAVIRKPGESCEVDWAGTVMYWQDEWTGGKHKAYLFVSCLSFSIFIYVEAFSSMNMASWLAAHIRMFKAFGGVTQFIICDNLKTGVVSHSHGETKFTQGYLDLARYYGTVLSAAGVRKLKMKPDVEDTVGIISNNIIARCRNIQFFSLEEINRKIFELTAQLNEAAFEKRTGSRKELLEKAEAAVLLSLPVRPYEIAEWFDNHTVAYNYHVKIGEYQYSVPFRYTGMKVNIKQTLTAVEIYCGSERIASHPRNYSKYMRYSTLPEHMPKEQQDAAQKWNEKRFIAWASVADPCTSRAIRYILTSKPVIQQTYSSCMAVLNLEKKYGRNNLETACEKLFENSLNASYTNIKGILEAAAEKSKKQYSQSDKNKTAENTDDGFISRYSELSGKEMF